MAPTLRPRSGGARPDDGGNNGSNSSSNGGSPSNSASQTLAAPAAPSPPQPGAAAAAAAAAAGIDESGPLVFAVGRMGPAYWDWVARPVPGKPRFFGPDALEAISKTAWWAVPLIWLPVYAAASAAALRALGGGAGGSSFAGGGGRGGSTSPPRGGGNGSGVGALALAGLQLAGVLLWQLLEYCIHRFAFHARGDGYWAITLHFLFHGNHHKYPADGERLVFPPVPAAAIAAAIYGCIRLALPPGPALGLMSGVLAGYVAYDVTHYLLHHGGKLPGSYLRRLRQRHHHHHYHDGERGFQISSDLGDILFGTRADLSRRRKGGGGGGGEGGQKD